MFSRLRQLHTSQGMSQVMVIKIADDDTTGGGDEDTNEDVSGVGSTIVCVVKYGGTNGVLEISPDFSHGRKPYRIEVWRG